MSTPEESRKQILTKVPTEGWCWLRQDSPDEHTRQYWREGKAFCILVARELACRSATVGRPWAVSVIWLAKELSNNREIEASSEGLALQAMDQVAIGIHATLVAQGIEIVCLNAAKGE